jgi:hypothetical protein
VPPVIEPADEYNSFAGNLPLWLEREKLMKMVEVVTEASGDGPKIYKAGRYGLSRQTMLLLEELGFLVDLSICSGFDYSSNGGPNWSRYLADPMWFGSRRQLLAMPTTGGLVGSLRHRGNSLWRLASQPGFKRLYAQALLSRAHFLSLVRLSPEGYASAELKRLTRTLLKDDVRVFSFSLHSPSLAPGYTPYVRTEEDRERLFSVTADYFRFFRDEIGGTVKTPLEIRSDLLAAGGRGSQMPGENSATGDAVQGSPVSQQEKKFAEI